MAEKRKHAVTLVVTRNVEYKDGKVRCTREVVFDPITGAKHTTDYPDRKSRS